MGMHNMGAIYRGRCGWEYPPKKRPLSRAIGGTRGLIVRGQILVVVDELISLIYVLKVMAIIPSRVSS